MFLMQPGDVQLVPGPLYHNSPLSLSTAGLLMGHHEVFLPKFDSASAMDEIGRHQVTWVNLVPTMMARMLRAIKAEPDRFDLSSLRVVWHMAAPCAEWLKQAWIDLVGPDKLMELFGGTEALLAKGTPANAVGEMVIDAMRSGRLYIHTDDIMAEPIKQRTKLLLDALPSALPRCG